MYTVHTQKVANILSFYFFKESIAGESIYTQKVGRKNIRITCHDRVFLSFQVFKENLSE